MARQAELGLLGLFFALLVVLPLPLAGNRPWAVALLCMAASLLLAGILWVKALAKPARGSGFGANAPVPEWLSNVRRGAWPLALLLVFTLWVLRQRLGLWGGTADGHETRLYFLRCVLYATAFGLTLVLIDSERRRVALFYTLLFAGILQALLAIGLLAAGESYNFAGTPIHHAGRALGTFANADHLAQYMALTLSAGVGLMLAGRRESRSEPAGWQAKAHTALEFLLSRKMLVRLMLVVLVIVLVLTRSRMGNGSFFVSLLLLGIWTMVTSASLRKPAAILVVSLLVVDLVVIGQWVGLEKVVQRLEATDIKRDLEEQAALSAAKGASGAAQPLIVHKHREETLEERLRAATDALKLVEAKPWNGWGGGSFFTVFPQVKRAELEVRFDHAHNDYVEIAADTGIPGLALLGLLFAITFARVMKLVGDDQPSAQRGLAVGIAMALLCALFHAVVDFNLQIPANAMTLTVLLAATWGMPLVYRKRRSKSASN